MNALAFLLERESIIALALSGGIIATVGSYVEVDGTGTANLAAFITAADTSLPTTSIDIYAQYNFKGEGNTLVVIDEDKSGAVNTGDTLIILTGLSTAGGLHASDFI